MIERLTEQSIPSIIAQPLSRIKRTVYRPDLVWRALSWGPFDSQALGRNLKRQHIANKVQGIMHDLSRTPSDNYDLARLHVALLVRAIVRDTIETDSAKAPLAEHCLYHAERILGENGVPESHINELLGTEVVLGAIQLPEDALSQSPEQSES